MSVNAFVDGAQVDSSKYVLLDPGSRDTMTFLWIPSAAKGYSIRGEIGIVSGENDKLKGIYIYHTPLINVIIE